MNEVETRESLRMSPPAPVLLWQASTEFNPLGISDVQVWSASLTQPVELLRRLASFLSDDELARANRFRFERDRNHFVVGRGILRQLLGKYLDCPAKTISFQYSPHGKPNLSGDSNGVRFNLAHSHGLALVAFGRNVEIGIDVEALRQVDEMASIAKRFFAKGEAERLLALPAADRIHGFFNCWTRKEAYLKATGDGITGGLDQFEVSLEPGSPARLLSQRGKDRQELERWTLIDLRPADGFVGALAVWAPSIAIRGWQWNVELLNDSVAEAP